MQESKVCGVINVHVGLAPLIVIVRAEVSDPKLCPFNKNLPVLLIIETMGLVTRGTNTGANIEKKTRKLVIVRQKTKLKSLSKIGV